MVKPKLRLPQLSHFQPAFLKLVNKKYIRERPYVQNLVDVRRREGGSACPQCGRVYASDFGLRSHLRVHQRPQ